jgi:hypothetical protein
MDTLQPLVNLLVLLTILSVAAERGTNLVKLGRPGLRNAESDEQKEKEREMKLTWVSVLAGFVVAVAVKADLFEILVHLDAPWDTLGWVQMHGSNWSASAATAGFLTAAYAIGGCIFTGVALGFGSKFWHDMLDIVFNARQKLKNAAGR